MKELLAFLEARIAEDAQSAFKHHESASSRGLGDYTAHVIADCEAKRSILKSYHSCRDAEATTQELGPKLVSSGMTKGLEIALKCIAGTYRNHPDYQEEWAKS